MPPRDNAGGRAGAGGFDYQHRVAAWLAVRILAASAASPVLPLWTTALERIDCETGEPVDDCRLTQRAGPAFVAQCKRTIDLSTAADGELAKTFAQFVDHYRLEAHRDDNMALVTSSEASGSIRNTLRSVLNRIREADPTMPIDDLPFNDEERHAYRTVAEHAARGWLARTGSSPIEDEFRALIRQCHVLVLDVEPGGTHESEAHQLLRSVVVAHPDSGDVAWETLVQRCARFAVDRSGANRHQLQEHMMSRNIKLKTVIDYQEDQGRLEAATLSALDALNVRPVTIPGPDAEIEVHRRSVDELIARAVSAGAVLMGRGGGGCV